VELLTICYKMERKGKDLDEIPFDPLKWAEEKVKGLLL
jgi:hypothetical protein